MILEAAPLQVKPGQSSAPGTVDGEDEATRLARRKRNWIPDVDYVEAGG